MRFKYIGLKTDGERAFMEKTGIEWMPGAEHDVDEKVAAEMVEHPTIWQQVGNEPIAQAAAVQPRARHLPADDTDDDQAPHPNHVTDQDVDDAATKAEAAAKTEPKVEANKPAAKKAAAKTGKPAGKTAKAKK